MWFEQTFAPGDPGKPGAPEGPTGPCGQRKNLQLSIHVSSLCYCYILNYKRLKFIRQQSIVKWRLWYVQVDQQDRADHHFHGHPEEEKDRRVNYGYHNREIRTFEVSKGFKVVTNTVKQSEIMMMLSGLTQTWICYSLQLQQLLDVPSHQADHVGPLTQHTKVSIFPAL